MQVHLCAAYIQLVCGWWIYFLHKSISALVTSTSTGVIALRNHPLGAFERENSCGCSLHTAAQNSREEVADSPILPFLFACPSTPS